MILKPFMLRRIKKDVENELSDKIEIMVHCPLTIRQKLLYIALKKKIKIEELLHYSVGAESGHNVDKNFTSNLMNLVMQFRKVRITSIHIQVMACISQNYTFCSYFTSGRVVTSSGPKKTFINVNLLPSPFPKPSGDDYVKRVPSDLHNLRTKQYRSSEKKTVIGPFRAPPTSNDCR